MRKAVFVFLIFLLISCVPESHPHVNNETVPKLNALKGEHKREVILAYGNPDEKGPIEGEPGEMWSYFFNFNKGAGKIDGLGLPAHSSTIQLMFFINERDTVYHWVTRKQENPTNSTVIY